MFSELKEEIERLRNSSGVFSEDVQAAGLAEIAMLKDALLAKEREIAEATRSWQEKLKNAEQRKSEEANKLEVQKKENKLQFLDHRSHQ